jgi:hypothetical protein
MKKLAFALVVAISLGGCAQLQTLGTAFTLATKSVTNPVTKDDLYNIESGISIALSALQAYKRSCVQGVADKNCRANISAIQVYTRQLPPLLAQLRSFVKNNDQVNATVVYNQVVTLVTNFKTAAANVGVQLGS